MDLRSLRQRLTALADKVPAPTTSAPTDAPITPEQRQAMDALERKLLARAEPYPDAADEARAQEFLRYMRIIRDAREREAERGKPFVLKYGIDVKAELASGGGR